MRERQQGNAERWRWGSMESEKVEANKNLTRVPLCAKGKRYLPKNPAANGCHGYDGREGRQALYKGKKGRWKIRVEIVCAARLSMGKNSQRHPRVHPARDRRSLTRDFPFRFIRHEITRKHRRERESSRTQSRWSTRVFRRANASGLGNTKAL